MIFPLVGQHFQRLPLPLPSPYHPGGRVDSGRYVYAKDRQWDDDVIFLPTAWAYSCAWDDDDDDVYLPPPLYPCPPLFFPLPHTFLPSCLQDTPLTLPPLQFPSYTLPCSSLLAFIFPISCPGHIPLLAPTLRLQPLAFLPCPQCTPTPCLTWDEKDQGDRWFCPAFLPPYPSLTSLLPCAFFFFFYCCGTGTCLQFRFEALLPTAPPAPSVLGLLATLLQPLCEPFTFFSSPTTYYPHPFLAYNMPYMWVLLWHLPCSSHYYTVCNTPVIP